MTLQIQKNLILSCLLFSLLAPNALGVEPQLNLNHSVGSASVGLAGQNGKEYVIESASGDVGPSQWKPFTSFVLTNDLRMFLDPANGTGNHFFRARERGESEIEFASDFRLIDQNGKSSGLYYFQTLATLKAIVLVFAQGDYTPFASKIAALKANALFKNSVLFWTIDTDPSNTRTNIARLATAAGITWPVFQDPLQLSTHDYDAHFNGEVFVIDRTDMHIVYRGAIDDGAGSNFLADALTNFVNAAPVITTRMEPNVSAMMRLSRPVADYSTVIGPMILNKCAACHSPDNIAPFVMTSYDDVVAKADDIKEELLAARMPPWHVDPNFGVFHNDLSLTPTQKAQLVDWLDAGLPRGTGPDPLTSVPAEPVKWPAELGEPDQIVTIPVQSIPATGTIAYRYIYANATNPTDRWLRAAIIKPGNRSVVHHYIVWEGHSNFAQLSGIAGYAPGKTERPFPDGTGILLKANSDVTFNLHYTATGKAQTDQPQLGLWYASSPPARALKQAAPLNLFFSIPPGNPDYEVTASQSFSNPATIFSFSPHMHVRGLRMRFELVLPDSSRRTLLSVPKYDFDWQTIYTLETPLEVPAGSRVDIIGGYDNSPQNLNNPDPRSAVGWGEQSWNEMFIGYMEYADR